MENDLLQARVAGLLSKMSHCDGLFVIDFEADIRRTIHDHRNQDNYTGNEVCYSSSIAEYINERVIESDRDKMTEFTSPAYILGRLKNENEFSVEYRTIIDCIQSFCEMTFFLLSENEVLQGVKTKNKEIINKLIFNKIEDEYLSLLGLDLDSGLCHVLKDTPWGGRMLGESVLDFTSISREFASHFKDETKQVLEEYSDISFLARRFAVDDKASLIFESPFASTKGWINLTGCVVTRHEDGSPSLFAIACSKADSGATKTAKLQKRLKSYLGIVGGLSKEFDVLHIIDLDGGECLPYIQNKGYEDELVSLAAPGVSWSQAHRISVAPMVHPDYLEEMLRYSDEDYIKNLLRNKRRHSIRILIKKELAGTRYYWCEFVIIKLGNVEEEAARIAMGYIDIDDQVRKELNQQAKLEEALALAQSASRAKTVFLNNMSHDIRTPMNAIIGYSRLAISNIDDKEQVGNYLSKIKLSSEHLLSLINEVLDMSRIESGNVRIDEKEDSISSIINDVRDIIQIHSQLKHQSFIVDYQDVMDDVVVCDRLRFTQILINILSNAVKYTPENGEVKLTIRENRCDESSALFEISIKDSGIGMSEDDLKSIFKPFIRGRSNAVSDNQGSGLGMPIAKNLIEMMGGEIDVQSEYGAGTEVILKVKFKIAGNHSCVSSQIEDKGCIDISGKKILVVEDNQLNLEIATAVLDELGCDVSSAENGIAAVEKIRSASIGDYDLILMDIQMPEMDGYEATRQIRAIGTDISHIPIVAMTANAFEEDRTAALEAGMNEHIGKPFDINNLKETLYRLLK